MKRPYTIEQLCKAEKYFANLKLEDIPQTSKGNKESLLMLKSMTGIFEYCSGELIKKGLENVNGVIGRKKLAHIPTFLPEVLPHHPLVSIVNSINNPPKYWQNRPLIAEKHLGLPLQVVSVYNLLYLY